MGRRIIEIYAGRKGLLGRKQWRARVMSANGFDVLFVSAEGYNNRGELIDLCQQLFPSLTIHYLDAPSAVS
jgi:hypothetical protein